MSTKVFSIERQLYIGEPLRLTTQLQFTNFQVPLAVVMMKDGYEVGHIPRTVSWTVSISSGRMRVLASVK